MNTFLKSFQYFLWLLAGSDIKLLKKNPTEQSRHANIGLAIFTTTLVAFVTGSLAGYEFSPSAEYQWVHALFFGMLWALIVFTIDRNMVLTLKKKPKTEKQRLWVPILYRIVLSAFISFFISIPLELWVFKEEIAVQMEDDDEKKVASKRTRLTQNYNIEGLTGTKGIFQKEKDTLTALQNLPEPQTKSYEIAKNNVEAARKKYDQYSIRYNLENDKCWKLYAEWENQIVSTGKIDTLSSGETVEVRDKIKNLSKAEKEKFKDEKHNNFWSSYKKIRKSPKGTMTIERDRLKRNYDSLETKRKKIFDDYYIQIEAKINTTDSIVGVIEQEITTNTQAVKDETSDYNEKVEEASGFISQWIALNNLHITDDLASKSEKAEAFWIGFFIWFIRIIFFIIELLPTMAKMTTPMSSYDWALYEEERKLKGIYEKKTDRKLKAKDHDIEIDMEKREILKAEQFKNLKRNILKNYFNRQNRLADKILEKWENEEMERIMNE